VSISLDILTPDEAAALFLRVAVRPDLAPMDAGVAEVSRLCGYLPLAIRMVAGWLLHHPSWTVTEVAAELAATQDGLAAIDGGQRSISAAFDLSYRELTLDQRRLFRRLGLQPGDDIDACAGAALGQTTLATAHRHLEDLTDLHVLDEPVRGRFRLHDLLRDYARALAVTDPPAEREAARDRLLDYYLHTATVAATHLTRRTPTTRPPVAHPPDSVPELVTREAAIAWLEAERATLSAATDYAARHARHDHAIYLPAAMHEFLRTQGPWSQAVAPHRTALDAARTTGDKLGEANTLTNLGLVQRLTGDYPAAITSVEQALTLYRDLGHRLGETEALNTLGQLLWVSGAAEDARAHHGHALDIAQALGAPLEQARALEGIGLCHLQQGQASEGGAYLRQALTLYRRLGSSDAHRVRTSLLTHGLPRDNDPTNERGR
jgi:tetratricopeptide (TPR) repeat protein